MKRQLIEAFGWKIMEENEEKVRKQLSLGFGLMNEETVIVTKDKSPFLMGKNYKFYKFKRKNNIDLQAIEPCYYTNAINSSYLILIIKDGNLMLNIRNKNIFLAEDIGLSGQDRQKIAGEML